MSFDRVRPLKIEDTGTGSESDQFPTELNSQEDHLEACGLVIQDANNRDESTHIWRSGADMLFTDTNNPIGLTLTELAAQGGTGDGSDLDFLLDSEPDHNNTQYDLTRANGRVIRETWIRTNGKLWKSIDYTRSSIKLVMKEVRKVFDLDGATLLAQLTVAYTRVGGHIVSAAYTRDL